MNFATAALVLILGALFALAIRYQVKNGPCAACEMKNSCKKKADAHQTASGGAGMNAGGCGAGGCASCRYYAMEQQALQKAAARPTQPGAKPTA